MIIEASVEIPAAFLPFYDDYRYKVAWGGRGAAKTESFARILVEESLEYPHKTLCCREIQKSINSLRNTKVIIQNLHDMKKKFDRGNKLCH